MFKKNSVFTKKETILDQMGERRPLPMGVTAFHEWADRIIAGALLPGATVETQKFALADMLVHLGPTESHKEDAFFIHSLRKFAVNEVADAMRREIRDTAKARFEQEQEVQLKIEIEKRYEDKIYHLSHEDKQAFIQKQYDKEKPKKVKLTGEATPLKAVANEKKPDQPA